MSWNTVAENSPPLQGRGVPARVPHAVEYGGQLPPLKGRGRGGVIRRKNQRKGHYRPHFPLAAPLRNYLQERGVLTCRPDNLGHYAVETREDLFVVEPDYPDALTGKEFRALLVVVVAVVMARPVKLDA